MADDVKVPDPVVLEKDSPEIEDEVLDSLSDDAAAVLPGMRGKKSGVKSTAPVWGMAQIIRGPEDSPLDSDGFVGVDPNFRRGRVEVESE